MTNRYMYEAEFKPNELGCYSVRFPQLPDAFTFGADLPEALERASEVLELIIAEYLDEGKRLPSPVVQGHSESTLRGIISVEVTPEMIVRSKCVTTSEAASMLGLSRGRITHMLNAGVLQAVPYGNDRLVTLASINDRLKNPRGAGRPRKEASPKLTTA